MSSESDIPKILRMRCTPDESLHSSTWRTDSLWDIDCTSGNGDVLRHKVQVPVLPQRLRLRPGQMPEIPPSMKYLAPREHEEFFAAMREECVKVNLLDKDIRCATMDLWWCSPFS